MDNLRSNDSKEIVRALRLAIAQVELSIHDSDQSVLDLIGSIMSITGAVCQINTIVDEGGILSKDTQWPNNLKGQTAFIQKQIQQAVHAFQFYDRVCQRLDHVARSLEKMSGLMQDNAQLSEPEEWQNLKNYIKGSYTMEAERIMFEYIMRGGTVAEALKIYTHHFEQEHAKSPDADNDEIELF